MGFQESITALAPPWLLNTNGRALLRTFGTMLDNLMTQLKSGIEARFPNTAPDDALPYIGKDRLLEQGPLESNDAFRARLQGAIPAHQNRGGPRTLLTELAGYLSGGNNPRLALVSDRAVWHDYDWTTGTVTRTDVGTNWNWDGLSRWWRGWVIIDGSAFGWVPWLSGQGVQLDTGFVMGSTAPLSTVDGIKRLVQRWKPGNVYVARIVVTFVPNYFRSTVSPLGPWVGPQHSFLLQTPENPRGQYGDQVNFDRNATFWLSGGEEP